MPRLLMITYKNKAQAELCTALAQNGLICDTTSYNNGVREAVAGQQPDILLLEMGGQLPAPETWELIRKVKTESHLPVIALVPGEKLDSFEGYFDFDDFITSPCDVKELVLRAKRLIHQTGGEESGELIKCDGLMIDYTTCEVTVDGRVVELTFKEYELLKLLAGNRGRVFTRDTLLDKIWGYDYYGGDRTVDVHVRRLRSKIEDATHTFIETVRNIGYRFRKDA